MKHATSNPATIQSYRVRFLPDPLDPVLEQACGGPVGETVFRELGCLLRVLAALLLQRATLFLRWFYEPKTDSRSLQTRLSLWLTVSAVDPELADMLVQVVESSPLKRLYGLVPEPAPDWSGAWIGAASDLVRRERLLEPLYTKEFNDRIPTRYYEIDSFEPEEANDFTHVERMLGRLKEKIVIEMGVAPVDHAPVRRRHAGYLAELGRINHRWDGDEDPGLLEIRYAGLPDRHPLRAGRALPPLRLEDPLAEDVRRRQMRFHETLRQPHLAFVARVFAQSRPAAHLVSSVLGESALKGGSYRVMDYGPAESCWDVALAALEEPRLEPFQTHAWMDLDEESDPFYHFQDLAGIAPVDQLESLFRLPVAACGSPSCIRSHTDPEPLAEGKMIILGYDEEPIDERS